MIQDVKVPDIGDYADVEVIDILVKVGDVVAKEDVLITLETEKAAMDIPSPYAGKITKLHVALGNKVSKGALIVGLEIGDAGVVADVAATTVATQSAATPVATHAAVATDAVTAAASITQESVAHASAPAAQVSLLVPVPAHQESLRSHAQIEPVLAPAHQVAASAHPSVVTGGSNVYASPGIRRFAHALGVNLAMVAGSGRKARIVKADVENYVRRVLASSQNNCDVAGGRIGSNVAGYASGSSNSIGGMTIMPFKPVDFAQFGNIETKPLARIKKISGATLHRNWVHIPHVTQFDVADITELEDFRQQQKTLAEQRGVKLTSLVFVLKAVVAGLQNFSHFNASLNLAGDALILKKYFHIGVAVDTPDGLVVPVVRDVDKKGILQLAAELGVLSQQARDGKLTAAQMQGGCFTISSLGGIGGTAFTPIINAPEVAILGVSKAQLQPVHSQNGFIPRLMLPLSLSYDHRVIDGAEAVRFTSFLAQRLADIRHLLL